MHTICAWRSIDPDGPIFMGKVIISFAQEFEYRRAVLRALAQDDTQFEKLWSKYKELCLTTPDTPLSVWNYVYGMIIAGKVDEL